MYDETNKSRVKSASVTLRITGSSGEISVFITKINVSSGIKIDDNLSPSCFFGKLCVDRGPTQSATPNRGFVKHTFNIYKLGFELK